VAISRKDARTLRIEAIQRRVGPTRPTTRPAASPERADEGFRMNDEVYSRCAAVLGSWFLVRRRRLPTRTAAKGGYFCFQLSAFSFSSPRLALSVAFFPGLGRVKDTLAVSLTNGGGGVGNIEFFVDVFDVVGHRGDADAEALRDFFL
jgi:hypothetical protein